MFNDENDPDLFQTDTDTRITSPTTGLKSITDEYSSDISPLSSKTPGSVVVIINARLAQLKSLTPPSDVETMTILNNISDERIISHKLASLLDYLIASMTSTSLSTTRAQKEVKQLRDELRISENRSSRLLLHLQQNVKLISRIATNENNTTLLQEANENVHSVNLSDQVQTHDYLKSLNEVFRQRNDAKLGIEALELLKQEIAINTIMRKQTIDLQKALIGIKDTMEMLKDQVAKAGSAKKLSMLKAQLTKRNESISKICEMMGCEVDNVENCVFQTVEQNKHSGMMIEKLKGQMKQITEESERFIKTLSQQNEELKMKVEANAKTQINVKRAKARLCQALGQQAKGVDDVDALVYAANMSIKIINEHKAVMTSLRTDQGKLVDRVHFLLDENEELKRLQEQNRLLMEKQTITIQELKNSNEFNHYVSPKRDKIVHKRKVVSPVESKEEEPNSSVVDLKLTPDDSFESDVHFGELNSLKLQFNNIGRELSELQNQIKAKMEPDD